LIQFKNPLIFYKISIQRFEENAATRNYDHQHGIQRLRSTVPPIDPEKKTYNSSQQGPQRRFPNALIIGVKKGGTGALLEFIQWHPDVRATGKEVHFFDNNYDKGLDWYRSQMLATIDGQITLEKTPKYFVTERAPKMIHEMNPKVKLILVVRDPTTRAVSDYTQGVVEKNVTKRFEELAFVNGNYSMVNTTYRPVMVGVSCMD
jgi:hypothetical protein